MSGDRNTHWCYQCLQPVWLRTPNQICYSCSGGFVQELNETELNETELNETVVNGRQDFDPFHGHDVSDDSSVDPVEAFVSMRQRDLGLTRPSLLFENDIASWESLLSSSANDNDDEFECFNGAHPAMSSRPSNSSNDGFMMPSFQELVEQIVANDIGPPGPRPASRSAIDSLPIIRITNEHLNNDSNCPVCQDKFELGSEARMMPCNHIYHSGCIEPWLLEHNSCPVCRLELPSQGTNVGGGGGGGSGGGGQNQGRWNPASLWWSFHS